MSDNGQDTIVIKLSGSITVRELAQELKTSPIDVIKILMSNGVMASINQTVDFETAEIVGAELGINVELDIPEAAEDDFGEVPLWRRVIAQEADDSLQSRPPVVTILGHVDHGKTTLLDAIRQTKVVEGEAGGITQHVGAYQTELNGRLITFLDTPGHAAFTAMRARGAQGADIVVLVVAADDGVMPQTKEAVNHAKAAKVPIIVALNKIDKPNADQDRVKQQLAEIGLIPDDWDGDTLVVPLSAKQLQGIEDLLEAILLVADNMNILANPNGKTIGTVIEAQVDKSKGVMATLLIQNGSLQVGDTVVVGKIYGRIKAMFDFRGRKLRKATPATPVAVMGLNGVPAAGDPFEVYATEREAKDIVQSRVQSAGARAEVKKEAVSLEQLFDRFQAGEVKELRVILKADVQGSLEPILNSFEDLSKGEIKINVLHAETGNISESDVMLASASNAIVIGFNVQADSAARRLAETEGISLRLYDIIYRMLEDVEKALKGLLEPEYVETNIGNAEVRAVFRISKVGNIAGCRVTSGIIRRGAKARLLRNGEVIHESEISSLKHLQEDVREVRSGFECGLVLKGLSSYQEGDKIQCYVVERKEID
jgi:translation initiation factor IF-2